MITLDQSEASSSVHSFCFSEMQPQPSLNVQCKDQDWDFASFCVLKFNFYFLVRNSIFPSCQVSSKVPPTHWFRVYYCWGWTKSLLSSSPFSPFICLYLFHQVSEYFLSGVEMTNRGWIWKRNSRTRLYFYKNTGFLVPWLQSHRRVNLSIDIRDIFVEDLFLHQGRIFLLSFI